MRKTTKALVLLFLTMLLFASPLAVFAKKNPGAGQAAALPNVVDMATAKTITWQPSINATGSLAAFNGITLKSEVAGRVTKIDFKSGQFVQKGRPLIEIFPDVLKAQLQQAQAQLTLSNLDYERSIKLYEKKYLAKSDLDKAKATLAGAEAQVNELQARLSQLMITAPFSGQLGLRQVSLGDFLNVGSPIVDLESLDPIRVDFNVSEIYASQIQPGQTVEIRSRAFPNQLFKGTILAINSAIDPTTRTLNVRATTPNSKYQLLPGGFVEITLLLQQPQQILVVPQTAIEYSTDGAYVYKVINNAAVKTKVTLGEKLEQNQIIITSGLKTGDVVVSGGQMKIQDGDSVMSTSQAQQMTAPQSKPTGDK